MATATLLPHALFCFGTTALILALRRDVVRLRAFGPQGANEDLDAFRRTFRGLGWKLPVLVVALIGR
ncbi:hypothetical protein [Brevundimonas sp.]|uniref:hypothetical protein n=1 Tax=Brevundimonas sp. TaxID=1871086 RepID=UPI003F701192